MSLRRCGLNQIIELAEMMQRVLARYKIRLRIVDPAAHIDDGVWGTVRLSCNKTSFYFEEQFRTSKEKDEFAVY